MRRHERLRCMVRNCIPDTPVVRRYISNEMEKAVLATFISEEDIRFGEQSIQNKKIILSKYKRKLGRYVEKTEGDLEDAVRNCARYRIMLESELDNIRDDARFCRIAYGYLPVEYVALAMETRGIEERKSYVSDQLRRIYRYRMNDILAANIFIDKSKTFEKYEKYFHRRVITLRKPSDFNRFHEFINEHDEFVVKNALDSLGKGVRLVKRADMGDERDLFYSCINKGIHVVEERIIQSGELSAFNDSSVNTVRVITVKTKNGIVVPYCILRMGRKGSFVDNSGNGGLFSCIEYTTGKLISDGYDESGNIYLSHPDSGKIFIGSQMPGWSKLKTLSEELASTTKKINFVGWDFAHTKDGWVLVEGNDSPHLIAQQMIRGGLKKKMDELLEEMDL